MSFSEEIRRQSILLWKQCLSHYVEAYALSHSMELADALIAGTCMEENDTLVTANDKHYKAVQGLQMTVFRP